MKGKFGFLCGVVVVFSTSAWAAYSPTAVEWQAVSGIYDGLFTEVNHWKGETAPSDYTLQAKFPSVASTAYTVTFPAGAYTNSAPVFVQVGANNSVSFSGVGTEWVIPGGDSDIHPASPFVLQENGYSNFDLVLTQFDKQVLRFDDFSFTWSAATVGGKKHGLLDCTRGTYVFAAPVDGGYASQQTVKMNYKDNHGFTSVGYRFGANTTSVWPNVSLNFNATTNILEFLGGTHRIYGDLTLHTSLAGDTTSTTESSAGLRLSNGASLTVDQKTTFGVNNGTKKDLHVDIDGSTLTFNGEVVGNNSGSLRTTNFRVVNGSTLTFNNTVRLGGGYDARSGGFFVTNSTVVFRNGSVQLGATGTTGSLSPFRFEAKDSFIDHNQKQTFNLGGNTVMTLVDCVWTNVCNKNIGGTSSSAVSKLILKGGTSYNKEDIFMSGGGDSLLQIDGGYHRINSTTVTLPYQKFTATIEVLDGTLSCDSALKLGYRSGGTAILSLKGGVFEAPNLTSVSGGDRFLRADGGTWRVIGAGGAVAPLTGITVGAGGFTVDTNGKSITFDQDFTGTGALILTGGGTVTFTAGNAVNVPLVVRGGTKVVLNGVQPKGLTVGDDGTTCALTLPANQTLTLDGDLSVNVFSLAFSGGTYAKATTPYDIFTVTGAITPATQEAWYDAAVSSGIASGATSVFTVDAGEKTLKLSVRDPMTFTVTVPDGGSVVTNRAIVIGDGDTLVLDVGANGSFASDFVIKRGILVKRGAGTVTLGCADNVFASVAVEAGELVLTHPGALGGAVADMKGGGIRYAYDEPATTTDGFYLDLPDKTGRIAVRTDVDVSVPLLAKKDGKTWLAQGGWTKEGPGGVAFRMPDENVRFSPNESDTAQLLVNEGEVAFRGTGETVRELVYTYMYPHIGMSSATVSSEPSAPGLVVDHVQMGITGSTICFSDDGLPATAGHGYLHVTNRASVACAAITSGAVAGEAQAGTNSIVIANQSSVSVSYRLSAYMSGGHVSVGVLDHSVFNLAGCDMRMYMDWRISGSSVFCGFGGGFFDYVVGGGTFSHDWTVESGSSVRISDVYYASRAEGKSNPNAVCNMTFDGGSWVPKKDVFAFSFPTVTFNLFAKGEGLVLAPTNGQVWTVSTPVRDAAKGAGGFVKRGAGTVVFDGRYRQFTGAVSLENGTLDLNGSTWTNTSIRVGAGVIANGALVKPTYALSADDDWQVGTLATIDPAKVAGRVTFDLGRTADDPLPLPYRTTAVATYVGDVPPDVSRWKLTGTGLPDARGRFSVETSTKTVFVTACDPDGFILFVR